MNEFILNDVKVLIDHINNICIKRNLNQKVNVKYDVINHTDKELIELQYTYYIEPEKTIFSFSIKTPYNQYLDEQNKIIEWANYYLYEDIILSTSFEPELTNINEKYKWN